MDGEGTLYAHANQSCLETVFQEYSLLSFRPFDIVRQNLYLSLLTVGYWVEEVEKGSN
jgi:hypothetical protein